MLEALAGLLGGVLGVLVGVYAAYWFEKRREWLDARTGLVLVDNDLRGAQQAVDTALEAERWPTGANKAWLSTWNQHRPLIARRLGRADQFRQLMNAYARMDELESGLNASRVKNDQIDEYVVESKDREFLEDMQTRLKARDEVFGDSPDYEGLLGGRRLVARWSNLRRVPR